MRKIAIALAILGTALLSALYTAPAHAQATRTWISGVGDDANPCSRTAPCKTFSGAIAKTAAGGEMNCLDPGGFGAVTITKAMTIYCQPASNGGVLVAGTNGIVVAAGPNDAVTLVGLDFEGLASTGSGGLNGVQVSSGAEIIILNCVIRDFTQNAVNVTSSTTGTRVVIQNSSIINNGTSGTVNTGGVNVAGVGVPNTVFVLNSLLENNKNYALQVGSGNTGVIANDFMEPTGLSIPSGGNVISFGVPVAGNPANAGGSSLLGGSTNPISHQPFN